MLKINDFDIGDEMEQTSEFDDETHQMQLQRHESGGLPSAIEVIISGYLFNFVYPNNLGWLFGANADFEVEGFKPKGKRKFGNSNPGPGQKDRTGRRQPDVAFVSKAHLPALPRGAVKVVPDLVVEVYSETDDQYDMSDKVKEYLAVGVPLIWVVRPVDKLIEVYRADAEVPTLLGIKSELDGGNVLPGFKLALTEIFGKVVEATEDEE